MTKIDQDKATITLPPAVGKLLEKGGEAIIDMGTFTIRIAPKFVRGKVELRRRSRADTKIWQQLEQNYRSVRAEVTRERYPYLYGQ